ncbi:long-chain fatty acid--CoA ligase [Blastococcus jejuensis]|uniref:Long-chain fatty acid--CoA ligase n=1 Tax=Blastococcus jejuensis TaxID=351224 RepID=A0ABP6P204_9ACTN
MSANLAGLIDGPARRLRDRTAVFDGDRPVTTWAGLAEDVARRAGGLWSVHGIQPGARVALWAHNSPAYLASLLAVWHAGAVAVPIAARLHPREAASLIADCAASLCLTDDSLAGGLAPHTSTPLHPLGGTDDDLGRAEPLPLVPRAATDDAWLFYTSGTTGRAKGARLSHANLLATASAYFADVAPVGPQDCLLHAAALSHASGLFALSFLGRGATQVLPASGGFDVDEVVDLVDAHDRTTLFVPPVLLRRLVSGAGSLDSARLGTVLVGAAPVRAEDLRAGVGAFGPRVWNGYGQGESPNTITAMSAADVAASLDRPDRLTSVGTARFATRVRVVDGAGRPLPPGEVGEVVVSGPTVMAGYLNRPDATEETLRDGWLHTGDLGRFDGGGYLTLVDRAKDVVITGGYNVYPREVEDVLAADPAVADVAVIGVPDEEWGERIVAVVVPHEGADLDPAALDARCLAAIARHKRPRAYVVRAELPRNPAGKVLKTVLREAVDPDREVTP